MAPFSEKKFIKHVMRALIFSAIFPETFLILRRIQPLFLYVYTGLRVKCSLFLSDFNETWII